MEYTIDIIDTTDDTHVTAFEFAEAGSLALSWHGSDTKDGQLMVGSSLAFTMEVHVSKAIDGYFRHLFTGDETKYKVVVYETETPENVVWSGFLLPDSYTEPYTNGTFYPSFEASDGLGRLKGKYLDDDYYEKEYSVIEYIIACLRLTGLELPLNVSPAIENLTVKNYNEIYISGKDFIQTKKYMSAYDVLSDLMQSMVCVLYQCENEWWVEGLNKRHLQTVPFLNYDADGNYLSDTKKLKLLKDFNGVNLPLIDVVAPYKQVTVTHEREPQSLPDAIAEETNDGWGVGAGVNADITATYWYGHNEFYAVAFAPDYKVALPTLNDAGFNSTKYVSLRQKMYVSRFDKLVFLSKFSSTVSPETDSGIINNGFSLRFLLNGNVLYSVDRVFDETSIEIKFDLFINEPGLLDLQILQPFWQKTSESAVAPVNIIIEEMTLKVTGFEDSLVAVDVINGDYSATTEIELPFADDAAAFSRAFRLAKLDVPSTSYNTITVPVLHGFVWQSQFYSVVSLYGANLIKDNIDTVYYSGSLLQDLEVVYNHLGGEQMVVRTPSLIKNGNFSVRVYPVIDYMEDRITWTQWTDAIYPIENDRYHVAASKVYRRMFINAHERVEYTAEMACKFNDLVRFNYHLPSNYFITNLTWNLDTGFSDITMIKSIYQNDVIEIGGGDNVVPLVYAGDDTIVPSNFGTPDPVFGGYNYLFHNSPNALDPDGFIVKYEWTVESGDAGAGISNRDSLKPILSRFDGQELVLRLTVTDNDGATAYDTVKFTKQTESVLSLVETANFLDDIQGILRYDVVFSPDLDPNVALTIKGNFRNKTLATIFGERAKFVVVFSITKNGTQFLKYITESDNVEKDESNDFEVNYIQGDDISIEMIFVVSAPSDGLDGGWYKWPCEFEITNIVFQNGSGNITGYPVSRKITHPTYG